MNGDFTDFLNAHLITMFLYTSKIILMKKVLVCSTTNTDGGATILYTHTSSTVHNISPVGGENMIICTHMCVNTLYPLHSPSFGDLIGQYILSNFIESFL